MSARHLQSERGAELIEFALVLPLLLLLVLGIVDFGFMFQRMEVVTNAAREGARLAVLPGPYDPVLDVKQRVCDYLEAGGVPLTGSCPTPTNPTIDVTNVNLTVASGTLSAKRVVVTYSHNYVFMGPIAALFGADFGAIPVRGVAVMRDEASANP